MPETEAAEVENSSEQLAALIKGGPDLGTTEVPAEKAEEAKPEAEEKQPAPGTPDKVLQKVQQDLSSATRKIDELNAKIEAGEKLTPKEQQQLTASEARLVKIEEFLADKGRGDPFEVAPLLAEELVETRRQLAEKEQRDAQREARIEALEERLDETSETASWARAKTKYAGVDVESVWKKSVEDSLREAGISDAEVEDLTDRERKILHRQANAKFHERAAGAATRKQATADTKKEPAAAASIKPGGAKVTETTPVAASGQPSDDVHYDGLLAALTKRDV